MMTLPDEEQPWMTIEDVRSGRWARWDALRQESQESQTRDSGIETGSCFTSSEDSNRGGGADHVGHSKKVRWRDDGWDGWIKNEGGGVSRDGFAVLSAELRDFVPSMRYLT